MGQVFSTILSFSRSKAGKTALNSLHLLSGYVQLLTMDEKVLQNLFPETADQDEIRELKEKAASQELDLGMLKKGISLLLAGTIRQETDISLPCPEARLEEKQPVPLFQELLDNNKEILTVFKNGCTLDDVFALKDRIMEKAAPRPNEDRNESEETQETNNSSPEEIKKKEEEAAAAAEETQIQNLALSTKELYYKLKQTVIGQDEAIDTFVRGYFKAELFHGMKKSASSPKAVFLFAGPPGVGKTLLATCVAEALNRPCLRINMSEYSDHQSHVDLIGISKKFGQSAPGRLTGFAEKNPRSIMIFDEIEKAHLNVIHLFLQILDSGFLQDANTEKEVSFRDAILIFTTNAGKKLYEDNEDKNLSLLEPTVLLDALMKEQNPVYGGPLFPASICSRFTAANVVMFNYLGARYLQEITYRNFEECGNLLKRKYGFRTEFDRDLSTLFLLHQGADLDARIISAKSMQFIQDEIYEFARQAIETVDLSGIEEFQFRVNLGNASEEIKKLFKNDKKPVVLLFGSKDECSGEYIDTENVVTVCRAESIQEMKTIFKEKEISFVVIDPEFGSDENAKNGFSLDDLETKGIRAFHSIREQLPKLEVYLIDREEQFRETDKVTFSRLGAKGFVKYYSAHVSEFSAELLRIAAIDYMQTKIRELAGRGKRLSYNTAQKLSEDKRTAIIEFYDFRLHTAIDAESRNVALDGADKPDTLFDDVIGAEGAKEELRYFIRFLKNPKSFILDGARPPRGILLYGPPGTGKTMLARAMAGEADATFFPLNATDFMDKYVGEGEARIRAVFQAARKYAPSIIFIDEIDAIAKERTGESHIETYLNTLMTEMDGFGFDVEKPVFVLAATNFALDKEKAGGRSVIDPALLRRFDNKIQIGLPDKEERRTYIAKMVRKNKKQAVTDATIENIADRTTGESLANLENIINLALRKAGRTGEILSDDMLLEAMEEFFYGKTHQWGKDYYNSVAHHEAGHAYLSYLSGKTPSYMTIVSRGDFGGYMQHASDEDTPCYTKEDLLWRIRTSLAGRASEIVFFGEEAGINTGISGDLQNATNLALQMVCRYGMGEHSFLSLDIKNILGTPYGDEVLRQAENIIREEMEKTIELVREGRDKIDALSAALLEKNQMIGEEIQKVLE